LLGSIDTETISIEATIREEGRLVKRLDSNVQDVGDWNIMVEEVRILAN